MILTDTRIIKPHNELYTELDNLCFLSKNLYNSTLFVARKSFLLKNTGIIILLIRSSPTLTSLITAPCPLRLPNRRRCW